MNIIQHIPFPTSVLLYPRGRPINVSPKEAEEDEAGALLTPGRTERGVDLLRDVLTDQIEDQYYPAAPGEGF